MELYSPARFSCPDIKKPFFGIFQSYNRFKAGIQTR
nr:MAG TPA: hypothetical protein [Caudoviricetes sp.]